jgi:serine/threonine-protein kinase
VVAYELLGGRHPFADKTTAQALFAAHLVETPVPLDAVHPGLPPTVVALVMRCLAKAPDDRPASAREVVELLGSLTPSAATLPAAASRAPSIAVLPFVNLSADPRTILLRRDQRGGPQRARPGPRASGRRPELELRLQGQAGGPADDGRAAPRRHVARGERAPRRQPVRITAQLVNAADGYQLWSARFDRELTDIFAVQDEIAGAIADTLRQRLREGAREGGGAASLPEGARCRRGARTRR